MHFDASHQCFIRWRSISSSVCYPCCCRMRTIRRHRFRRCVDGFRKTFLVDTRNDEAGVMPSGGYRHRYGRRTVYRSTGKRHIVLTIPDTFPQYLYRVGEFHVIFSTRQVISLFYRLMARINTKRRPLHLARARLQGRENLRCGT